MSDMNSALPIRTEEDLHGRIQTKIVDFTNPANGVAVDSNGNLSVEVNNSLATPANTQIVVGGSAIDPRDIRDLTSDDEVSVWLHDHNGAAFSTANPLPVIVSATVPGTDVLDFKKATAVASGASDTHTFTVAAGTTLNLQQVSASGSGRIKMEVQINGVTKIVKFNSTATPNCDHSFFAPQAIEAGIAVSIIVTNMDKQAQDLYSTIEGNQI